MRNFEIVAHRGVHNEFPENTISAFESAIALGADAVELDVRLTSDHVPVVFHYFYLDEITSTNGPVFNFTYEKLHDVCFLDMNGDRVENINIPSLVEVLDVVGGRIGLEIEIKGPEPESSEIVGSILGKYKHLWETIEITSYEPMHLIDMQRRCPDLATDLLFPRSQDWMGPDVVAHQAIHRSRLACARAVHLHPTQLTMDTVSAIRENGIQVHAWDVNDEGALSTIAALEIPKFNTDKLQQAIKFCERISINNE